MELLIPGLILVALMVYASTRIKKSAALAYEAETIETEDFVIQKPDGFLNVIGGDPQFAFEAYSKEFGGESAPDFRRGYVKLRIYDGISADEAAAALTRSDAVAVRERSEVIGDTGYRIIETKRFVKGVELNGFYKIAEKNAKVYELEIIVVAETTEEFMGSVEAIQDSFELR